MNTIISKDIQVPLKDLVQYYVNLRPRFTYKDICLILNEFHCKSISIRQLKYLCKKNNWNRKKNVDNGTLEEIVNNEIGMYK